MSGDRTYYKHYFPADLVTRFLMRHATRVQKYRAIALRWQINGKPILRRFNSYANATEMAEDFTKGMPTGIYVGPAYNTDPTLRWVLGLERLKPVSQPLIFDIDLPDYDDIRCCDCVGKENGMKVCSECWPLAACAIVVLRNLLCYKFGFHEFLFTFSGGKGVHCWVLDADAQSYEDNSRLNLSTYFTPFIGIPENDKKHLLFTRTAPVSCPVMQQCYEDVLKPLFEKYIIGKTVNLRNSHGLNLVRVSIIACEPDTDTSFLGQLPSIFDQAVLWKYLESFLRQHCVDGEAVIRNMVFMCCFPRLDKDITTTMQHLIRLPFSVNGPGGKVCVPLRYRDSFDFSPELAPTSRTINENLVVYTEILEEALEAPWAKLWVCMFCVSNTIPYREQFIFLTEDDWVQHHEEFPHGYTHTSVESTVKAMIKGYNPDATAEEKKAIYVKMLQTKNTIDAKNDPLTY